jgi:hypothetical protein
LDLVKTYKKYHSYYIQKLYTNYIHLNCYFYSDKYAMYIYYYNIYKYNLIVDLNIKDTSINIMSILSKSTYIKLKVIQY